MMTADPRFECAFVATSYLLGRTRDFGVSSPEARALCAVLANGSRSTRAAALAQEVARIAVALDAAELKLDPERKR
jgi:hypothetical protein